jgi:LAO/AO transport system kinase
MPSSDESPDAQDWIRQITAGDRVALAKAITLIESERPQDRSLAAGLIKGLPTPRIETLRIGITGPPGVGKSTFINVWGGTLARGGHHVAVLAVDPTSRVSYGSILGDKTRMETLAAHPNVFVRPSPSGSSGRSITRRTREVIRLCEAAGFDRILVETVGVGQSEVEVRNVTDLVLLLVQPGAGDELQGIKKGIIELADGLVITKADGDTRKTAERALADFTMALRMLPAPPGWNPRVVACSSVDSRGLDEVTQMTADWLLQAKSNGSLTERRASQDLSWMKERFAERIEEFAVSTTGHRQMWGKLEQDVRTGALSPVEAADKLWDSVKSSL